MCEGGNSFDCMTLSLSFYLHYLTINFTGSATVLQVLVAECRNGGKKKRRFVILALIGAQNFVGACIKWPAWLLSVRSVRLEGCIMGAA